MASGTARFRIAPRLASLLGEGYRSSEQALKELVDNAWDADATSVIVTIPAPMSADPIIIEDDGSGMSEEEVRSEYLLVAGDRRGRKGEHTPRLKRKVKGRKGIGKFAGLMAASVMVVETRSGGKLTRLVVNKDALLGASTDLDTINFPLAVESCPLDAHGTTITLSGLNQALQFPSVERLREHLVLDYGRAPDFLIVVDTEPLSVDDIRGDSVHPEADLPGAGPVRLVRCSRCPG